jgi:membrane-associated phospholipid phosphatase
VKVSKLVRWVAVSIACIVISYFYIDRSVVWYLFEHQARQFFVLKLFAEAIPLTVLIFIFCFFLYYATKVSRGSISHIDRRLLLACNAVVIGQFLKEVLKVLFGRYWPATFVCHNPSLINDQVYGFNWLKFSSAYASFPSGHTTFIFSFSVSMCFLFAKWRWLWILLALLVVIGQIGMYYHFVSDVIAGALLGSLVGFYTTRCQPSD